MNKRIVFTGGGTGGHVFPGLAVLERLQETGGYDLYWMGSCRGIEYPIVQRWGIPFLGIPSGKLRRYVSVRNIIDVFKVAAGLVVCLIRFLNMRPHLVFSKGGYVTVPPVFAARLLRIPVVTHDSDLDPGLATRLNARAADRICLAYEQSRRFFPAKLSERIRVTGNPVRAEILRGDARRCIQQHRLRDDLPLVFVQGGSQGADEVNTLLMAVLPQLLQSCVVIHQTGESGIQAAERYLRDNPDCSDRYVPAAFFTDEYPDILAAAELSVSRAGAGSLWELAATRTPGVILPLVVGSRGDQVRNAALFADMGIVAVADDNERTPEGLMRMVTGLLEDQARREQMQAAAAAIQADQAVNALIAVCEELLCS